MEYDGTYLNDSLSIRANPAHCVLPSRLCLCLFVLWLVRVYNFKCLCLCCVQRVPFLCLSVLMLCLFRVYVHMMSICVRVYVLTVPI